MKINLAREKFLKPNLTDGLIALIIGALTLTSGCSNNNPEAGLVGIFGVLFLLSCGLFIATIIKFMILRSTENYQSGCIWPGFLTFGDFLLPLILAGVFDRPLLGAGAWFTIFPVSIFFMTILHRTVTGNLPEDYQRWGFAFFLSLFPPLTITIGSMVLFH